MKKIFSIISAALLSMFACVPAYAAETIGEVPGNAEISVYAKYVDNTDFTVIPTDDNGGGSITLPDGTEITVSGADSTKGRIFVEEVTDPDVLDWIAAQLDDKASGAKAYHVYCLDGNGVSMPTDGVNITIKAKDGTVDAVYTVGDDKTEKLQFSSENGEITFATNGEYFYAMCSDSGNIAPQKTNFPFWIIPIVVVGCAMLFIVIFIRKRKRTEA